MEKEQEIHLELLQELSSTNKKLSLQLKKTMLVVEEQDITIRGYRSTCRQIFESLEDKGNIDVLESSWHKALRDVLNRKISLRFDGSVREATTPMRFFGQNAH